MDEPTNKTVLGHKKVKTALFSIKIKVKKPIFLLILRHN